MEQTNRFIYDIHQKMRAKNVLLAFTGEFDKKIISALISSVKLKLQEAQHLSKVEKKVYYIMDDCLEAIFHGFDLNQGSEEKVKHFSIFTLTRDRDFYYLISGNYILNDNVEFQKGQIDRINSLNATEQKKLFRECLTDGNVQQYNQDMAMVDIAIKSENRLEYEFKKVDSHTSFYIFKAKIKVN